jgi:hypothetical protein
MDGALFGSPDGRKEGQIEAVCRIHPPLRRGETSHATFFIISIPTRRSRGCQSTAAGRWKPPAPRRSTAPGATERCRMVGECLLRPSRFAPASPLLRVSWTLQRVGSAGQFCCQRNSLRRPRTRLDLAWCFRYHPSGSRYLSASMSAVTAVLCRRPSRCRAE